MIEMWIAAPSTHVHHWEVRDRVMAGCCSGKSCFEPTGKPSGLPKRRGLFTIRLALATHFYISFGSFGSG